MSRVINMDRRKVYDRKVKEEVLSHYGRGKAICIACGENQLPCLSLDHINNDGAKQRRKKVRGGIHFYHWLRGQGYPEGYQTLCMNCQFVKRELSKGSNSWQL